MSVPPWLVPRSCKRAWGLTHGRRPESAFEADDLAEAVAVTVHEQCRDVLVWVVWDALVALDGEEACEWVQWG